MVSNDFIGRILPITTGTLGQNVLTKVTYSIILIGHDGGAVAAAMLRFISLKIRPTMIVANQEHSLMLGT